MENIIITAILTVILGLALFYIIKSKKNGKKCIGCPYVNQCSEGKCNCITSL